MEVQHRRSALSPAVNYEAVLPSGERRLRWTVSFSLSSCMKIIFPKSADTSYTILSPCKAVVAEGGVKLGMDMFTYQNGWTSQDMQLQVSMVGRQW